MTGPTLHIYNPSTDMAMVAGLESYTPPRNVANFEREYALFPALYASEGDAILLPQGLSEADASALRFFSPQLNLLTYDSLSRWHGRVEPWGWNAALRNRLVKAGIATHLLPSREALAAWRRLAHRRNSITLARLVGRPDHLLPREFSDPTEALTYIHSLPGAVLKLPWSSSGRGILMIEDAAAHNAAAGNVERRVRDGIANQGSVIVEPLHQRSLDFATEWWSTGSSIRFLGWSLFRTDGRGHYRGNVVDSQEVITSAISEHLPAGFRLSELIDSLCEALSRLLLQGPAPYEGPFGVDGLITSRATIIPTVEINLRNTMGHVALKLFDRRTPHSLYQNSPICVP
jgi:hypothetical protein